MSDKFTFEESLKKLEETIQKLESGNCTLDESIKLFEAGMQYTAECRKALDDAEKRITELSNESEGKSLD